MQERSFSPTPWAKVGLAIFPGLLFLAASSGLVAWALGVSAAGILALCGFIGVCLLLVIAGFVRERRLPIWSFPAIGILLALPTWWWVPLAMTLIMSVVAPSTVWPLSPSVLQFALLGAIAVPVTYLVYRRHGIHIPRLGWVLLGLIILFGVAEVIITTLAAPGVYERVTLLARLWNALWVVGVVLSPVAIGLPLAWRSGIMAGLMVVAFQYVMVDMRVVGAGVVVDGRPTCGICACTANQLPAVVLASLPVLLFLFVSPIWVLRTRSAQWRAWGLVVPLLVALVAGAAIGLMVCPGTPGEYWFGWWLRQVLTGAQYTIAMALAVVVYRWIERQGAAAGTQEGRKG